MKKVLTVVNVRKFMCIGINNKCNHFYLFPFSEKCSRDTAGPKQTFMEWGESSDLELN